MIKRDLYHKVAVFLSLFIRSGCFVCQDMFAIVMTNGYRIAFTNSSIGRCIPTSCAYSGNGGFCQKNDTNYCRTDKLTSFGKLYPTKNFGSSSSRSWSSCFFFWGGAVWCGACRGFESVPNIAGEALLEWWTFECLEFRAKTNGFWATNMELKRGGGFLHGVVQFLKKPCHATCWVDKIPTFEVVEKLYCQTWRMKHFLGLDESSHQSVMVQFSFVWNTYMVSLGHHFYQTHRVFS